MKNHTLKPSFQPQAASLLLAPIILMATPTASLSPKSRPSRPPPVLRRCRNFQPATALVNQSTSQLVSQWLSQYTAPCCPLSCALGRRDVPIPVPQAVPGTRRQALGTLADPSPSPVPTTPLASPNHFAGRRHTSSLRDANPKAPNSRHTDFARTLAGGGGAGD